MKKEKVGITKYKIDECMSEDTSKLEVQFIFLSNDDTPNKYTTFLEKLNNFLKENYDSLI